MNNFKFEHWKGDSGTHYCWASLPAQTIFLCYSNNPLPGLEGMGHTEPAMALGHGENPEDARQNAEAGLIKKLDGKTTRSIHTLSKEGITQW